MVQKLKFNNHVHSKHFAPHYIKPLLVAGVLFFRFLILLNFVQQRYGSKFTEKLNVKLAFPDYSQRATKKSHSGKNYFRFQRASDFYPCH
jgi:GH43 family beta-xylosidase